MYWKWFQFKSVTFSAFSNEEASQKGKGWMAPLQALRELFC